MIVNIKIFSILMLISININAVELNNDLNCLAANIYKEARGESLQGKIAVGLVTINRVEDKRWPNTVCKVVKQKNQFSWYKKHKHIKPKDKKTWEEIVLIAKAILSKESSIENNGALYFLNLKTAKHKSWTKRLNKIASIDNHTFFKN